jgi:hypothetical protein
MSTRASSSRARNSATVPASTTTSRVALGGQHSDDAGPEDGVVVAHHAMRTPGIDGIPQGS